MKIKYETYHSPSVLDDFVELNADAWLQAQQTYPCNYKFHLTPGGSK